MKVYPSVRLLIIGLNGHEELRAFMSHIKNLEVRDIEWRNGCVAIPSFERALAMLPGCINLQLVHVHKGEGYSALKRDCETVAKILKTHPLSPWLNLNGNSFKFLEVAMRPYLQPRFRTFEEAVVERWEHFGPTRYVTPPRTF